ncbi:MAG: threonine synthase [Hydrogenophilales bacterium 16-64-46]|nr:MAG: threonine synthase [Hydrogenophilales bacterium 12-64-13]OYZ04856.1 MAG: threonine synthase [Hydrogenophilales bacterium 16-64-46]OZA37499.1 MAG: threonine synthase [Hydrogenophilales bacterium 17-64-34]HQT00681.1 threonine synthase [Thiobacillus sp.]
MNYLSTRGLAPRLRFSDILLGGLASDGGLYVPESYPRFSAAELAAMRGMNYRELAFEVLSRLIDDIPHDDLKRIIDKTYTAQTYRYVTDQENAEDITPLKTLEPGLHILALSNGPTLAFKDMAMQLLGNLFEYALDKTGGELNILGATSGDTGSAAEYAMRGKRGIRVFMLSPEHGMTRFQQAQMYALMDDNIHNLVVRGVFDQCQDIVKAVSNDLDFKARHHIGAVNSINWARVAAQSVYYFKAWFAATHSNDQEVSFSVPSGNFGNVCAGHIARQMGLPIRKLIVATNENDVLDEFFRTGVYRPRPQTKHTSSPSMDISKASNFERFIFDLGGRDAAKIRSLWGAVETGGSFDLKTDGLFDRVAGFGMASGSSSHANRLDTIRTVYEVYGTLIDPHTADGLKVGMEHREPGVPLVCMETAQPAKFEDAIREALHIEPVRPAELADLEAQPQRKQVMDVDVDAVKRYIVEQG